MTRRDAINGIIAFIVCALLSLSGGSATAQVWKPGRQLLMQNNAKAAEAQLMVALKKAKSKSELAETYKFLGVAQFMAGNKAAASSSFQKSKSINPGVTLSDSEVVDESVIPFFKSVNPASIAGQGTQRRGQSQAALSRQKSKKTLLKVMSNVPAASVRIDGIAHGNTGDEIEVDPGTIVIEVTAPGYRSAKNSVKIERNMTSVVTVNLDKIQPKPRPKPLPLPSAQTEPKGIPLPNPTGAGVASANGNQSNPNNKKNNKDNLFGDEPSDAEFAAQIPAAAAPMPSIQPGMNPQMVVPPAPPVQPANSAWISSRSPGAT